MLKREAGSLTSTPRLLLSSFAVVSFAGGAFGGSSFKTADILLFRAGMVVVSGELLLYCTQMACL